MSNTEEFVDLLHREMEQFIDEGYAELDQKEAEMEELGLLNYGDSSYYIQNPDEYEKDKKICELENEVERLKVYEKAFQLLKYKHNYFTFVNENIGTIDVDLAISMAREMLKDE